MHDDCVLSICQHLQSSGAVHLEPMPYSKMLHVGDDRQSDRQEANEMYPS